MAEHGIAVRPPQPAKNSPAAACRSARAGHCLVLALDMSWPLVVMSACFYPLRRASKCPYAGVHMGRRIADSAWLAAALVVGAVARRSTGYARGRGCSELTLASRAGRRPGSVPSCAALADAHDVQ
jgi:hypothetical protein